MKTLAMITLMLLLLSCMLKETVQYNIVILDNKGVHAERLSLLDPAGSALLRGYLYAYGNECVETSTKNKCYILTALGITNECENTYLTQLKTWFYHDPIMKYKLSNCPALPLHSAIDNAIDKIILHRSQDTISIEYTIKGLNNSQEKNWNLSRIDTYLIQKNTFIKT